MCVYSMVMDHFQPRIPKWNEVKPWGKSETETLQELLDHFHEATKAAKKVDELTKQPDCADPEKKKLEDRVAILEKELAKLKQSKKNKKNKK